MTITIKTKALLGCAAAMALTSMAAPAFAARDYVWAAGSSTVFPFATRVAENYAKKTGKKAPKVESLGTGGGIKLFCSGTGDGFPDIANASRPMKKSEFDACASKGVKDIVQIKIGFDGIVIAIRQGRRPTTPSRPKPSIWAWPPRCCARASSSPTPTRPGTKSAPACRATSILVYGPPPTSGTRDAFVELAIEAGARKFPTADAIRSDNEKKFKELVDPLRKDGWVDAGENDNAIVQTLTKTPGRAGRLRLVLPRREHGQDQGLDRQRREALAGHHRRRLLPAVALALHLRQEGQYRGDPGPPANS